MAHDPFERFAGWNDTDWIKNEVERVLAKGAGVKVETLRRARRRIVADGYHGPFGDRDWEAMDGARMTMKRAVEIVRGAQDADLPTVRLDDPDVGFTCRGIGDGCEHPDHAELQDASAMFHTEPVELDGGDLLNWYFGELKAIYGTVRI